MGVFCSGCFTYVPSKNLQTLDQELSVKAQSVEAIAALERSQPDQAMAGYEAFLKGEEGFSKPLVYYQNQLSMQLRQMSSSQVQVLGDHVIAAFPYYYHKRLKSIIDAHLGLSRIRLARGDLAAAERSVREALDILNRRARSRVFIAQQTVVLADQLGAIAAQQGSSGKGLVIKLDRDIADQYLKSEVAARELARDAETRERIHDRIQEIDKFIVKVNRQRTTAAILEFMSNLGDVAGGFNFAKDVARAASAVTAAGKVAQAATAGALPEAAPEVFVAQLDPVQYPSPIPQLLDPRQRAQVRRLLGDFAVAAGNISTSAELREASTAVSMEAEAVAAAGRSQDVHRMEEAAEKFAGAFARLRSLVEALR